MPCVTKVNVWQDATHSSDGELCDARNLKYFVATVLREENQY